MNSQAYVLSSNPGNHSIVALVFLRAFFVSILIYFLDRSIGLGTPPLALSMAAFCGIALTTLLAFSRLNTWGFLTLGILIYAFSWLSFYIFSFLPVSGEGLFFISTVVANHVFLFLHVFATCSFFTWLFWKVKFTLTLEILALIALSVEIFRGHRNFHFEAPRLLNNLAWDMGLQPLSMLLITAAVVIVLLFTYVYLASLYSRLHFSKGDSAANLFAKGRQNFFLNLTALAVFCLILIIICGHIYDYYQKEAVSRIANGVGQETEQGVSPLDFHSALGSTAQPAGVVRLEGDYQENPYIPMLYLRESALSEFNGKEMVIARTGFDQDVSSTSPQQVYKIEENNALVERVPVVQSIYLLADHKLAFALDYPLVINQLKNPNPKRFKAAYRAMSMAPSMPLDTIRNAPIGSPKWSQAEWEHYLTPHHDIRYADLAMKITNSYTSDSKPTAEKAFLISEYLSKNSIYTLTPNHDVKAHEDPVVPYLFGDMRGYCVHFAHATVYMLRALGVPSRIATGYLTDLSQARDGHILLRMSDRHAWAEVYVEDHGWIPFDTQPETVESHADTQIDMRLLEELMGMLDPGEELLSDNLLSNELNVFEDSGIWLPAKELVFFVVLSVILLFILLKIYLRLGWLLSSRPENKLKRSYVSVASKLCDLGFTRFSGETRQEFRTRLEKNMGMKSFILTDLLNYLKYRPSFELVGHNIDLQRKKDFQSFKSLPIKHRLLSALNPASVIAFITGRKW